MSDEIVFDQSLDQIFENLPISSITRALGNNLYGINFRNVRPYLPRVKDSYGFTFFTRPQLNLDFYNITNFRGFYSLLTRNRLSYQRYVRMMLDPRLGEDRESGITCPFVDNKNCFIPILTNTIISLSGWPDLVAPTYTSSAGLYGEEHSFVDGVTNHFEAFDVDATFENVRGNPLVYMFYTWIRYQTLVFEGILNPYLDFIIENEIDYNTRIYRIVLDSQKRYVTFAACTGASFPINVPTGNLFDFNVDSPYNNKNSEINIRFKCLGFTAFEDIVKKEFNEVVGIFNPDMRKILEHDLNNDGTETARREDPNVSYRSITNNYVKIPYALALTANNDITNSPFYNLNFRSYPYINLFTNELEWWTDARRFTKTMEKDLSNKLEERGNMTMEAGDFEEAPEEEM